MPIILERSVRDIRIRSTTSSSMLVRWPVMTKVKAWMPFYGGDFLLGTMGWRPEQVGHYIRLLCVNWDKGSIPVLPSDWDYISPGASAYAEALSEKFPLVDGVRSNPRVRIEKEKAQEKYSRRCEAGKRGAEKRWGEGSSPSPSIGVEPNPTAAPVIDRGARDARKAWEYVPAFRQQGFKRFLRVWEEYVVRQAIDPAEVVKSFRDYYASPQGKGQYCKGPIKLIEGGVWEESAESWGHIEQSNKADAQSMLDKIMEEK